MRGDDGRRRPAESLVAAVVYLIATLVVAAIISGLFRLIVWLWPF